MLNKFCSCCGSTDLNSELSLSHLHSSSQHFFLKPTLEKKVAFELLRCTYCGHLQNGRYLAPQEEGMYLFSVSHSLEEQKRQKNLVNQIERLMAPSKNKRVLEVGCGDGYFLECFCQLGYEGIGYEPSFNANSPSPKPFTLFRTFFQPGSQTPPLKLAVFRHVLEHVEVPLGYLADLCSDYVYVEVPNANFIIQQNMYFDLCNDHISYFTKFSLTTLLFRAGFDVQHSLYPEESEFIGLLAQRRKNSANLERSFEPSLWKEKVSRFGGSYSKEVARMKTAAQDLLRMEGSLSYWGAGTRGVTLLQTLQIADDLSFIVDSDPEKNGKFIAGIPEPIKSPDVYLKDPNNLIVSSYTFKDEILQTVKKHQVLKRPLHILFPRPLSITQL